MPQLDLSAKLAVLADAAKYDASCASSAAPRRSSLGSDGKAKGGLGSTEGSGICHAYAPDGRCISLLKILLTNSCLFDCAYCINRASSNVQRARFTVEEVVALTLDFYRRNYIEGLFLSSGIIRSPDYTMEQLARVARELRVTHGFRGYIHLKSIPDADPLLLEEAGRYADRLSINIEMPTERGLTKLAPEKRLPSIRRSMGGLRVKIEDAAAERKASPRAPRFAPAGQSTQMIIGADEASDVDILQTSVSLYSGYKLRRVYYSAFSPIPDASSVLPLKPPSLLREHRLYQADWLFRFYGFSLEDIAGATDGGMFDTAIDPKLAWALRNRAHFPVCINRGSREWLLRVPGLGAKVVDRILVARRHGRLTIEGLKRLGAQVRKAMPFIEAADWQPGATLDGEKLAARLRPQPSQLELFG
jgi:putative DNA modification/repair radical SAM protein